MSGDRVAQASSTNNATVSPVATLEARVWILST